MAQIPTTQIVTNTAGRTINLALATPNKGTDAIALTPPVITNLGYGGTLTSGSPGYYTSGGGQGAQIIWKNALGNTVEVWTATTTAIRDTAFTAITAGITAGTPVIAVTI